MSFGFLGSSAAPVHAHQRFLEITINEDTSVSISGDGATDLQTAIHNPLAAFTELRVKFINQDVVSLFQKLVQSVLQESVHLSLSLEKKGKSLERKNVAFKLFIDQMLPALNNKTKKLTIELNGFSCLFYHRPQFFDEFPFRCLSTSEILLFPCDGKLFNWLHDSQYRIKFFQVTPEQWGEHEKTLLPEMVDKLFASTFHVANAQFIIEVDMGDKSVNLEISKRDSNEFDRLSMTIVVTKREHRNWYIQRGPKTRTYEEWKILRKEALDTEGSVPVIDINVW
ncbi:hypothetical protein niasHT_029114 [Heterodera trifolii]|uniref:Uncharacterized protein n=1 Tax=Heterodera trifolii TaxID=157864 RepID=A0ABD2KNH0_9BILA